MAAIRSKLIGACADEKTDDLEELVQALFQDEGYVAVKVKNLDLKMLDPLAQPKHIKLEAEVAVGQLYSLAEIKFVGNHAVAAPKLRSVFSLRKGDVFKRRSIAGSFEGLRRLYSKSGFGDLTFIPDTQFLANSTVILTLTIIEGPQYHMGKLKIFAKQDVAERLQSGWRLPEGAVFNFDYVGKYQETNRELLPNGFSPADLRIVRNCPEALIEVRLILDQTAPTLQSQPTDVSAKSPTTKQNSIALNNPLKLASCCNQAWLLKNSLSIPNCQTTRRDHLLPTRWTREQRVWAGLRFPPGTPEFSRSY